MPKNKLSDLRDQLFETIEALKDSDKPMEIDRAKAVCAVADRIIDTAKVEVKAAEVVGAQLSEFMQPAGEDRRLTTGKPNGHA